MNNVIKQIFHKLKNVFQQVSVLIYFNPSLHIKIKTNAFNFELTDILSQFQKNKQWWPVIFYSKKMIFAERNYKTHDQKILIIILCFEQWKHYLKNNAQPIEILTDHNNLKRFINVKMFNEQQIKWVLKLTAFDFVIKHRLKKSNPADASFQRFDYQDINGEMQNLLPILQQKLSKIELMNICTSKMRLTCVVISQFF